jgi:hypothetical protein
MHLRIKLGEKETLKDKLRIEEIRGVFILGLLAILVSIRFKYEEFPVHIGQFSFNLIGLVDITIGFWILYAYFMILGISEDIIGKKILRTISRFIKIFSLPIFPSFGTIFLIIFLASYLTFLTSDPLQTLVLTLILMIIVYKNILKK